MLQAHCTDIQNCLRTLLLQKNSTSLWNDIIEVGVYNKLLKSVVASLMIAITFKRTLMQLCKVSNYYKVHFCFRVSEGSFLFQNISVAEQFN